MNKVDITLYYNSLQDASEAGFPDAIELDEGRYMAIASFECDDFEVEVDDLNDFILSEHDLMENYGMEAVA